MTAARRACAATGHPRVTEAAMAILAEGGNAFDAAVAAGFAGAVAEPALTSLGGGGFLLGHTAEGRELLFDFFVDTPGRGRPPLRRPPHFEPVTVEFPGSRQDFNVGLGSVAVPGSLKGYLHVHERLGRLPLETVVAPAVDLARNGVVLNHHQAYFLSLLAPIMTWSPEARGIYAPRGRLLEAGDRFHNLAFATFLEGLPVDRGEVFYRGELARTVARDMDEGRGRVHEADLAGYRVVEREPLRFTCRGARCLTNPAPSFGGRLVAYSLKRLEAAGLRPGAWGLPAHFEALGAVMQEVEATLARVGVDGLDGFGSDPDVPDSPHPTSRRSVRGTTHVSVADREGNLASMTTSNGEGSGYVVPSTGIMLNNMLGEDDLHPEGFHAGTPGERVASMMSPTLVFRSEGSPLALGSGGSKRIRTALFQTLSHLLDAGLGLREAVEAPRMHWDGEAFQLEPGFDARAVAALEGLGPVNVWTERNAYFGGVQAVAPGEAHAADPRRGGHSAQAGDSSPGVS